MTDYPMKRIAFVLTPGTLCCPDDPACPYNGGWYVLWQPRNRRPNGVGWVSAGDKLRPARRVKA